ncbi:Protein of unknown function, putative [Plasmodium vivax]|uniref:Variable surface protein Vir35 n=2 Tax=Plasmodium vivax TaxID=5855 RepID=A0A1G4H7T2_PLAVI|nr:hypothetical protein PVBG_05849 [Plasmodium vivax Brazil I]SCO70950.1 Protein of unknown function, putative [Plasmodium vivax]
MVSLSNYYQEINLKFTAFLKTFTFFFLIWTYITYNDMGIFPKSLENKYENGKILNRNFRRLLAKHELHRELRHVGTGAKLFYDSVDKSKRKVADDITISSQLNKKGSNNVETYMKNYKRRYEKKKGLYKLDCYCEKKVFDKLNYIYTFSDKMKNDKKGFKNKIRKKYGIGLIILSLIPALGLMYYILFGYNKDLPGAIALCRNNNHYGSEDGKHKTSPACALLRRDEWDQTLGDIGLANAVFSFTMITIVVLFFIYIFIKVIKYKKLKAGRDKMSLKEYYRFTKSLL